MAELKVALSAMLIFGLLAMVIGIVNSIVVTPETIVQIAGMCTGAILGVAGVVVGVVYFK